MPFFSPFAKQWIFRVTGANQNARKLVSTDLVNTNNNYYYYYLIKLKIAFYLWMETIVVYTTALVAKIINIKIKFIVIILLSATCLEDDGWSDQLEKCAFTMIAQFSCSIGERDHLFSKLVNQIIFKISNFPFLSPRVFFVFSLQLKLQCLVTSSLLW